MKKSLVAIAAISGAIAVMFGAFGAHALKSVLTEDALKAFHTGVEYQFYHTFALLAAAILFDRSPNRFISAAGILFTAGIILFSGSLYLLTLSGQTWMGVITPFGGLCFIVGWIAMLLGAFRKTVS